MSTWLRILAVLALYCVLAIVVERRWRVDVGEHVGRVLAIVFLSAVAAATVYSAAYLVADFDPLRIGDDLTETECVEDQFNPAREHCLTD